MVVLSPILVQLGFLRDFVLHSKGIAASRLRVTVVTFSHAFVNICKKKDNTKLIMVIGLSGVQFGL